MGAGGMYGGDGDGDDGLEGFSNYETAKEKIILVTVFENCFFVLKNKDNKENMKNMFGSQFFIIQKNTKNTKSRE